MGKRAIYVSRAAVLLWLALATGSIGQNHDGATIGHEESFECEKGLVFIKAAINQSRALDVVLDTGASVSVIAPSVAQELKLKMLSTAEAAGPGRGSNTKLHIANGVAIETDGVKVGDQNIAALPVDYIAVQAGHPTEGILSVNAFASDAVDVDYETKRLRFVDSAKFAPSPGAVEVPLKINDGVPLIQAQVQTPRGETATGTFILDSGFTATIIFSKPFLDLHPEFIHSIPKIDVPRISAVGGSMQMQLGRISSLQIGHFVFKEPIANFPVNPAGVLTNAKIAGIVGAGVLKRFHVVYDYLRSRILLAPNTSFDDPFEADMSGLRLVTDPPDFHRFIVRGILANSPAALADIRPGDIVVAVDDSLSTAHTLSETQEKFETPGKDYKLTLERGGERIVVRIKTRRLI
jgi:Aspartyl protease/PDZ domain